MTRIETTTKIVIHSGEGAVGGYKLYTGKHTQRALNAHLRRERCDGDRWADAYLYSHSNEGGSARMMTMTQTRRGNCRTCSPA